MLKVRHSFMGTDEDGDEVFIAKGDKIDAIEDAGPTGYDEGWAVSFRVTTPTWCEIVTCDAVKLLKSLVD